MFAQLSQLSAQALGKLEVIRSLHALRAKFPSKWHLSNKHVLPVVGLGQVS